MSVAEVAVPVIEAKPDALTRFHQRLLAEALSARGGDGATRVARALSEARVDLNPHQVEAAAFALDAMPRGGCLLADEVGLGKTIEAGIVIAQLCAEGKGRILILTPATLRAQWQAELQQKFELSTTVVDGRTVRATGNCFDQSAPVIASIPFAAGRAELLAKLPWDLVVIDEAHRLRNAHKSGNKTGKALRAALKDRPKLLLTATPLQNELGELFGLLSLLDEQILGPEEAFKAHYPVDADHGGLTEGASIDLKERLAPVVQRTLRRQVREYVRFTNRRSVVEDFAPSAEEQGLYDDVSEYLRRSEAAAIEPGKKTLLTLVYRKLLASSTYAIAPTLQKLADSLEERIKSAKLSASAELFVEPEDLKNYAEESDAWADEPSRPVTIATLQHELKELRGFAERAAKITVNAKGEALKRALDRLFTVARAHQWPQKAVIFTESKRTQQYLNGLLSAHGWAGKIALLSGDAGSPEERRALVERFRGDAQILLSTEAGAEGLNLQFCNLVVNFDLPWNPQRVEQRIGRCHRYGQERDVLVLNFLNRQNAADARLYELLEKKLHLFDGVFGASDEILGALENGVDFEKRILDIYQSCRSAEEISAAFEALQKDLEGRIDQRMTGARSLLLERFDGDVRRRLKLAGETVKTQVGARKQSARALTGAVPGVRGVGRRQLLEATSTVRARTDDAIHYLALDAATLPPKLGRLAGKEGWWFAYRLELSGLKPEDRLLHLVMVRDGEGFRALPLAEADSFPAIAAADEPVRKSPPISVALEHEKALLAAKDELVRAVERRSAAELDAARERADRFAEDCLLKSRSEIDSARADWEGARRAVLAASEPGDRLKLRAQCERLERDYRRRLQALRLQEEQRYGEKDRTLAQLAQKAKVVAGRSLIASAYFWLA